MTFTRYAVYFAPPADADWVKFATSWLGWDVETGSEVRHPAVDGIDVAAVTKAPRKYGLHATMKPPFRLHPGQSAGKLHKACATLAATCAPITLEGLDIARMGRFLALRPKGDTRRLDTLAAACVRDLDIYRAPAPAAELAHRRGAGLSPEHEVNLTNWGYPYVMGSFRFHITLTGKLDKPTLKGVQSALDTRLSPLLPAPFRINDLALVGEAGDGQFQLIHRYALSG